MKFGQQDYPTGDKKIWRLEIEGHELVKIDLDKFDYLLIEECGKSESIADKLLVLEMYARKIEEARSK